MQIRLSDFLPEGAVISASEVELLMKAARLTTPEAQSDERVSENLPVSAETGRLTEHELLHKDPE